MKKKNQFLFLYPIKEYFDVGLGKDAFAYLANKGLLENTPQEIINEYKIIVHATPLGTFPNIETYPNIPYQFLTSEHYLFDLVYNPEETEFMRKGKEKGAKVKNGLEMLKLQAEYAWKIWNTEEKE